MKQPIFKFTICSTILVSALLIGCNTSADKKEEQAKEEVTEAKDNLKEVQAENLDQAKKTANAEEWAAFKKESEYSIKLNEERITELRHKMKKSGKTLDEIYLERVQTLERKNVDLKNRIDTYNKNQSNWEEFKREYKHDMDELAKALKDFTINNKS
jgi:hypothetical protein